MSVVRKPDRAMGNPTDRGRTHHQFFQHDYLRSVRAGDRATEFKQRCVGLKIKGVTLHSYRYAWAERAKSAGYPERYAMENLGHNSRAMAQAYSRKAKVELPSLGEYERQRAQFKATPVETPAIAAAV